MILSDAYLIAKKVAVGVLITIIPLVIITAALYVTEITLRITR